MWLFKLLCAFRGSWKASQIGNGKRRGGGFKSQIPNRKQEKERRRVKSLRTNKCSTFQTSAHALDKSDTETVLICIPRTPSPCRTFAYIIASVIINTNPALCYFGQFCLVSQIYVLRSNGNGTWCYQCDLLHQQ